MGSFVKTAFKPARGGISVPTTREWLLACAIAAGIVAAYFWRTELRLIWESLYAAVLTVARRTMD